MSRCNRTPIHKMCHSSISKRNLLIGFTSLAISATVLFGLNWIGRAHNTCQTLPFISIFTEKTSQGQLQQQSRNSTVTNTSANCIPHEDSPTCRCNISAKSPSSSQSTAEAAAYISWAKEELRKQFQPSITEEEKRKYVEAIKALTNSLDSAGIRYFMNGGTLIGSWRHHDMIPWDDDVDIMVNDSDRNAVARLRIANYTMNTKDSFRYRFMCNDGVPSRGEGHTKWPFIDIIFFGYNGTHIYDMWKPMSEVDVFRISDILPLKRRPYGNLTLYAPHRTLAIIKSAAEVCITREWSHRDVIKLPQVYTVDCKLLHGIHPFVVRNGERDTEQLYLDGKLLRTFKLLPG